MKWPSGVVSPLNIPAWRDFPLRSRLAERLPGIQVRVHNDAICLVAAEHWRGAGRGRDNVLGMVVSTGVGGGLVLDGRLVEGASGNAGHIGHVVVDPDTGPVCDCGGRGCPEAIARGPALVAWAQSEGWRPDQEDATAKELAARRRARPSGRPGRDAPGRPGARHRDRVRDVPVRPGSGLGRRRAIPGGPAAVRPAGGGPSRARQAGFARQVSVVPAALGQSAGLVGAAALIFAADRYWAAG